MSEIKQRGESKPHPAPFIGNGCTTPAAGDLAGQDAFMPDLFAIEIMQMIKAGG